MISSETVESMETNSDDGQKTEIIHKYPHCIPKVSNSKEDEEIEIFPSSGATNSFISQEEDEDQETSLKSAQLHKILEIHEEQLILTKENSGEEEKVVIPKEISEVSEPMEIAITQSSLSIRSDLIVYQQENEESMKDIGEDSFFSSSTEELNVEVRDTESEYLRVQVLILMGTHIHHNDDEPYPQENEEFMEDIGEDSFFSPLAEELNGEVRDTWASRSPIFPSMNPYFRQHPER